MTYRLGVDVGGTFTDVLLVDEDPASTWRAKTSSTPARPVGRRARRGRPGLRAGRHRPRRRRLGAARHHGRHQRDPRGQGRPGRAGHHQGFRQVLQIARSFVPGGLAGWIIWPKPEPLAALENTVEVPERRSRSDGPSCTELDEDATRAALRSLRDAGIEALAVSLINAFANGAHERRHRRARRRGTARRRRVAVQRRAARAARVRARADHGGQQLRPARRSPATSPT